MSVLNGIERSNVNMPINCGMKDMHKAIVNKEKQTNNLSVNRRNDEKISVEQHKGSHLDIKV